MSHSGSEAATTRVTRSRGGRSPAAAPRSGEPAGAAPDGPIVLERYRLVRRLGSGAFGTVWRARDERLERDVAVKILSRERIVGGRFEREARAAARLSHPAIVTLYEAAVDDEGAYLVSELVIGATLDALLAEGRLSDRDILSIGIALCDALEHAHGQGVVHRDVKPSNILVPDAPPSPAQVAKLTDFGVARLMGAESLTLTGDVIGTLAYMAPEQADGDDAGPGADLYSLALVLYEALTGINPVAAGATQRTLRPPTAGATRRTRRPGTRLPPLRRQRRDLPAELGEGLDLALWPRPGERGSVADLRSALALAADEVGDEPGVVAPPATPWTTIWNRQDEDEDEEGGPALRAAGQDAPALPDRLRIHPRISRGLGAAATGALTAWLVAVALSGPLLPPAPAGLLAAALVLLLPRLGWALLLLALTATAVAQGHPGTALILALGLLAPVILLPRRPALWAAAAGAPALGLLPVAGLAGAWPALGGRALTPWRRAALGALGWLWLLLAVRLAAKPLYLPWSAGPSGWSGSASITLHRVLEPVLHSGLLAPALVWAAAATVLPWVVRGRDPRRDALLAALWATILTVGISLSVGAVHGTGTGAPPGAVVGAVAAAVLALAPTAWNSSRRAV